MKIYFSLFIAFLLIFLSKSLDFETNISNLHTEDDEELMRLKSVACLYILNLRYDYNKEFVELNLRQSPHEDKVKLYDKLLFTRLKYCLSQINHKNASFITFNLNNDKTLNDLNFYHLIESGEKEEEILLDMDQSLDLDEEEQAIKDYINNGVHFTKNELIPEQTPEFIEQEEFKKIAEDKLQKEIEKDQQKQKQQQQQQQSQQQQKQQQQQQYTFQNQIIEIIQNFMKNENFKIYLGLAVGLLTGLIYACNSKKKQASPKIPSKKQGKKSEDKKKEEQKQQEQKQNKIKKLKKKN